MAVHRPETRLAPIVFLSMVLFAQIAGAQQQMKWDTGIEAGVAFANIEAASGDLVSFFCRETKTGHVAGLILRMPVFTTRVRDGISYSLNVAIDGARESLTVIGKDIDLWYEATDLNQQMLLSRVMEHLQSGHQLELAVSSLGWRAAFQYEGAAEALAGIMDSCL